MVPTIEGQTYNFINSGLYDGLFVLQDTETETLWNHMTGEAVYGLHAGLGVVLSEGLEEAWKRHQACGDELHKRLPELGFELWAQEGHRLPALTTVTLPQGLDDKEGRQTLLERYGIEVGGGLGPVVGKVWRIGCMGHTARLRNVKMLLGALEELVAPNR